jgi:hypothetical protein
LIDMSSSRGSFGWWAAASSSGGSSGRTAGSLAASAWLRALGLTAQDRWHVEIALDTSGRRPPTEYDDRVATRFELGIYSEEWGLFFCHAGQASWIRVADLAFVHGRDDFSLLGVVPPLKDIGQLLRRLEQQHTIRFQRDHASIKTNLADAEPAVASWIHAL